MVTLGCARNEVDSEELAGRLAADGYELVDDADDADAVLVNTCGFIETAKKDSVDAILAATDSGASVVAVGCMAERYGSELAGALPEATVLGFDDYGGDRRPARRRARRPPPGPAHPARPPHAAADQPGRSAPPRPRPPTRPAIPGPRLAAPQAAGVRADRCAEARLRLRPALRVLRHPDLPRRVRLPPAGRGARRGRSGWPSQGVTELVLVSENSTSYGKDLGDLRSLEKLLPQLAAVEGIARVRVAYLQPAELRPGPARGHRRRPTGVAPYFDLSFQHSSPHAAAPDAPVRRHRRLPRS